MNSFTNTIVLHVARAIESMYIWFETFTCLWLQYKSSGLDILWTCDIYSQPVVDIWELQIMLELIEKL